MGSRPSSLMFDHYHWFSPNWMWTECCFWVTIHWRSHLLEARSCWVSSSPLSLCINLQLIIWTRCTGLTTATFIMMVNEKIYEWKRLWGNADHLALFTSLREPDHSSNVFSVWSGANNTSGCEQLCLFCRYSPGWAQFNSTIAAIMTGWQQPLCPVFKYTALTQSSRSEVMLGSGPEAPAQNTATESELNLEDC